MRVAATSAEIVVIRSVSDGAVARDGNGVGGSALTQPNEVLAPEEPNVYRLRDDRMLGAPGERNVPVDHYVQPFVFRSAGAKNFIN